MLLWFASTPGDPQSDYGPVPDFSTIDQMPESKAAFFGFLKPMIEDQNNWILENRSFLHSLRADLNAGSTPSARERQLFP